MLSYTGINGENRFLEVRVMKTRNKKIVKFHMTLHDSLIKNKALKRPKFSLNF